MPLNIKKLLDVAPQANSRWYLDNIVWNDRTTNPETLVSFLARIIELQDLGGDRTTSLDKELEILESLANDMDQSQCEDLLNDSDETTRYNFIEKLARQGALETLCTNALSIETMTFMCKLSPEDFIMVAKRSQDIINSVQSLVIQGETLSKDIAGA